MPSRLAVVVALLVLAVVVACMLMRKDPKFNNKVWTTSETELCESCGSIRRSPRLPEVYLLSLSAPWSAQPDPSWGRFTRALFAATKGKSHFTYPYCY